MTLPRPDHLPMHSTDIQVRFGDSDALGHLNNAAFATYAEIGRLEFLSEFPAFVKSLILAHLQIEFRQQVTLNQVVSVDTAVERVGASSVHLRQWICADDEVAAEVSSVVVHFDYATQTSQPVPDDVRSALVAMQLPAT